MAGVVAATERSIEAASHLTKLDEGAVAALRTAARKVDEMDSSAKFDNVSLPTYLKFCAELGLTPAGRKLLEKGAPGVSGKPVSGVSARRAARLSAA